MGFFQNVKQAPPDPILSLTAAYRDDPRKEKVNLGVGIYMDEELNAPVLKSVKKAEEALLLSEKTKEYLSIVGDSLFLEKSGELIFGEHLWTEERKRIVACQSLGGTGALRVGGTFLKEELNGAVAIPDPTWPNHKGVFLSCGLKVVNYPYYDFLSHEIDFEALCTFFRV